MKSDLSTSTFLSSHTIRPVLTEQTELPEDLQPAYCCSQLILDNFRPCPAAGCANNFTVRHGVCGIGLFHFYGGDPFVGSAVLCSVRCLLQEIASHGGDGFRRQFRDTTKTLH